MFLMPIVISGRDFALYHSVSDSLLIGITGIPYSAYSSDKGLSFGLSIFLFEKNISSNMLPGQDFRMRIDGEVSTEKEQSLSIDGAIPLRQKKQRINFNLEYKSNYNDYHGIGGNTPKEPIAEYKKERYTFNGNWVRFFKDYMSAGVAWDITGVDVTDIEQTMLYSGFSRAFGVGAVFTLNTKLPNNFPTVGYYYNSELIFYDKIFNSDDNFITLNQEFQYIVSKNNHIIAKQIISKNNFKDTPFHYLPEQGGSKLMRGLKSGRYVNEQYLGAQAEYRSPIFFWRVSAVCFGATAISYKGINDFDSENLHFTGGFGLRFALDKSERVNLRVDIGFSHEGQGIYLKFGEAF